MQFYPTRIVEIAGLKELVDDRVTERVIPTPMGWKCARCPDDYFHTHGPFLVLEKL